MTLRHRDLPAATDHCNENESRLAFPICNLLCLENSKMKKALLTACTLALVAGPMIAFPIQSAEATWLSRMNCYAEGINNVLYNRYKGRSGLTLANQWQWCVLM